MTRMRKPVPDQHERDAAVAERARNVLVEAGAGTGKTTILVERLVGMVAPEEGGNCVPIARLAAITFTRKAAGELRLRIRERLLEELARAQPESERAVRLRDALAGLDTACVGTIHSFADRLLRLRLVDARLSPSCEVVEDDTEIIRETFNLLLHASESGKLASEIGETAAAPRAEEAAAILRDAIAAGLKAESWRNEHAARYGLDALIEGFIRRRDIPPSDAAAAPFDAASFRTAADEFIGLARTTGGTSAGAGWIAQTAEMLEHIRNCDRPAEIFEILRQHGEREPKSPTKKDFFAGDNHAWKVWKTYCGDDKGRPRALRDELCAPVRRWMATRLVRLFPVVTALYERVKAGRRQLDQLDLLLKLRNLLRDDRSVRLEFQRMFDHILVDEFQDTDPLQAEIVLYLCEREPRTGRWEDVEPAGGKLTLVGDPKQSIYRFRRADVALYDRVCGIVARRPHLAAKLSANFRSVPPLIDWCNDRFARILGISPDGRPFDPGDGNVFQQPLAAGRGDASGPAVCVLPFGFGDEGKHKAEEYRRLEGRALARWLRWLVEASGVEITDPVDAIRRPARYGDVAILAVSTANLPQLFPWLDEENIPYASRGGTLFLGDPLHRQFLLGLRALADREDGVAEAALLRPPFFAVDFADLVREHALVEGEEVRDDGAARARSAREMIRDLRRRRFDRPAGATARDLLECTGFGRAAALGPNGAQRLARLRELCLVLDQTAAEAGLDYDATTARLREWVERPVQLDPPHPVDQETVQVITAHQAKGLEFPVVVIWDGKGRWPARPDTGAWNVERDGRGWTLDSDGLSWEEPDGLAIRETELRYLRAEKRRVVYVAATRARDLLVIPRAGDVAPGSFICGDLLDGAPESLTRVMEPYFEDREPSWSMAIGTRPEPARAGAAEFERHARDLWESASGEAERAYPAYVAQLRAYGRLLEKTGVVGGRALRCGLLFTADGTIRWVQTGSRAAG